MKPHKPKPKRKAPVVRLPKEKREHTGRGFRVIRFADQNGVPCNIQKSSLATNDCLWIGCEEIGLKRFGASGWESIPTGEGYIANNRMHLSRDDAAALLPILKHFCDTGELP